MPLPIRYYINDEELEQWTTTLSQEIIDTCRKFANDSEDQNKYYRENRRGGNSMKVWTDIYTSKVAEHGVYEMIRHLCPEDANPPDMVIYDRRDRNFTRPDLGRYAVKSCLGSMGWWFLRNSGSCQSWTVQQANENGHGGRDKPILDPTIDPELMVVFSVVETDSITPDTKIYIRSMVPVRVIHEYNLLKPPIKMDKQGIKLAIYSEDLMNLQEHHEGI